MLKIVNIREKKKIKKIVMTEKSYMFDGWYRVFLHHTMIYMLLDRSSSDELYKGDDLPSIQPM
jgi:hypothetical protein